MRLLDRYLLREWLTPFIYCLIGFLIFWISFDLLSQMDDFQRNSLTPLDVAHYYLLTLPEFFVEILPITLLMALLYALGNHARHHEITAIRAAGISFWRVGVPYLAMGFLLSLIVFILNELWVPTSGEKADALLARYDVAEHPDRQWKRNLAFVNARDHRDWNIARYNLETFEMENPQISWLRPDGGVRHIFAERGAWTNGMWVFYNVSEFVRNARDDLGEDRLQTNYLAAPEFTETPALIKSEIKASRLNTMRTKGQLSIQEILDYQHWHPAMSRRDLAFFKSQLYARIAMPWTCVVVVLIALPFGAVTSRRNVFVGVASSIVICFVYFVVSRFALALGYGGYLPAWLAAWLPNLVFALGGFGMVQRLQ